MQKFMTGALLDAIPPGFWAGLILGAVILAVFGGSAVYLGLFIKKHFHLLLILGIVAIILLQLWGAL